MLVPKISINRVSETYIKITCPERGVLHELSDRFTFEVPGAKFSPQYKCRYWDGKIRLFNLRTGELPYGLHHKVREFADENKYEYEYLHSDLDTLVDFSEDEAQRMYRYLNLHSHGQPIEVRDHQHQAIVQAIRNRRTLLLSPTACHPAGTVVIMADGSFKNVEDVAVGDQLLGPDGTVRNVLRLYRGKDEIFEIQPFKGKSFKANRQHMLSLVKTNEGKKRPSYGPDGCLDDLTINEYLTKPKYYKHLHKLYHSNAVEFPGRVQQDLPISPYFLGALLGDGHLGGGISVTTADPEILAEIHHQAQIWGLHVRTARKTSLKNHKAPSYFLTTGLVGYAHHNMLLEAVRKLGLYGTRALTKFIPEQYLYASIKQRRELLAGLIDTDGHLHNGTEFDFVTKSPHLRDQIAFLSRSLGLTVSIREKLIQKYPNNTYYRLIITGPVWSIPTKISSKTKFNRDKTRHSGHTGFKLRSLGAGHYFGFEIDGDHRYLLDDFLVTHNSGKSAISYCLVRYYLAKTKGKILIIVPTTALVEQMYSDFQDYSSANKWSTEHNCHRIYSGKDKTPPLGKRVVITTWQSIFRLPPSYFESFEMVFGDEAHQYSAKNLNGIMDSLVNCRYRVGATGTVQDSKTNVMQLEGMFGPLYKTISTKELMEKKMVAELTIKCLALKYPDDVCKVVKKFRYEDEVEWLVTNEDRNKFIRNLALSLKGNTLILFQFTDKHGKPLFSMIQEKCTSERKVFYVDKDVKPLVRDQIRGVVEKETDAIIVASYGTFSTGVNIRNIDNVIFASPTKSKIRVLQSIGRGLRMSDRKNKVTQYDIVDDLQHKTHENFALKHAKERLRYYNLEKFRVKTYKISLHTTPPAPLLERLVNAIPPVPAFSPEEVMFH